jgi:hypothetical protein
MMSLKIELERAEERMECVEYRLSERAGEIEEALDSYVTRVSPTRFRMFEWETDCTLLWSIQVLWLDERHFPTVL